MRTNVKKTECMSFQSAACALEYQPSKRGRLEKTFMPEHKHPLRPLWGRLQSKWIALKGHQHIAQGKRSDTLGLCQKQISAL